MQLLCPHDGGMLQQAYLSLAGRPLFSLCLSAALTYAKHLIKANYNEATETEINTLLDEAKTKSTTGKTAYNGKGISVGYLDSSDYYQYQVLRFYK